MWQGIQVITNYKTTSPACDSDASLPDMLNDFYARFKQQNNVAARKTIPPPNDQVLCLSTADIKRTLCQVHPRKFAGPDNIPGRVLRECAEQLADVFVPQNNDHCPCAEEVYGFMRHIKTQLPPSLDPLQFVYRPNRFTDDAITTTLHLALTYLDNKDSYVRMLFIDFSSAFNTIIPQHLQHHHTEHWSPSGLCAQPTARWLLTCWRSQSGHSLLFIDGFLDVHLTENFTWSLNTSSISKKAQQRLYFLRRLRKDHLPPHILTMFYRGTIESILSSCITAWFGNCTVPECKTLQWIVRTAEKIKCLDEMSGN
ncbi:hypothetical protein QTP86_019238, partial [Hemibagrus guttatus]